MRDALIHAIEGALGGAIGSLVHSGELRVGRDPGRVIVERLERYARRPVSQKTIARAALALHGAYRLAWGAALGVLVGYRRRTLASTAIIGATWGATWGAVTGLAPRLPDRSLGSFASALVTHAGSGVAAALSVAAVERLRRRSLSAGPWRFRWPT